MHTGKKFCTTYVASKYLYFSFSFLYDKSIISIIYPYIISFFQYIYNRFPGVPTK